MSLRPRTKPPATGLRYGALNGPAIGLKPGVVLPLAPPVHKPVPQTESTDGAGEQALRGVKRLNNWLSRERNIPSEVVKALDKIEEDGTFRENQGRLNDVYKDFIKAVVIMVFRKKEGDAELFQEVLTSRKNTLLRKDELFEQKTAAYAALGAAVAYIFKEENVKPIMELEDQLKRLGKNDPEWVAVLTEWFTKMDKFEDEAYKRAISVVCYSNENPDAAPC